MKAIYETSFFSPNTSEETKLINPRKKNLTEQLSCFVFQAQAQKYG